MPCLSPSFFCSGPLGALATEGGGGAGAFPSGGKPSGGFLGITISLDVTAALVLGAFEVVAVLDVVAGIAMSSRRAGGGFPFRFG